MRPMVVLFLLAALSTVAAPAFAGEAALAPVIASHEGVLWTPKSGALRGASDQCDNGWTPIAQQIPCSQFDVQGAIGVSRAIYLVAVSLDISVGVAGISCGIDYEAAAFAGVRSVD